MSERSSHYRTREGDVLSPRQREVLDLMAAGKTNGEIAATLGISLDGAKWHVSTILAHFNVSTREEAVEASLRDRRFLWGLFARPSLLAKWAAGLTGSIAIAGAAVVALTAVTAPSSHSVASSGPTATATSPAPTPHPEVTPENAGSRARDFVLPNARSPKGNTTLSAFRGQSVVLLFYASWCDPCRSALVDIAGARTKLPGVHFIAIDELETATQALGVVDDDGQEVAIDSDGATFRTFVGTSGLPVFVFIDPDGVIGAIRLGDQDPARLAAGLATIGVTYAP